MIIDSTKAPMTQNHCYRKYGINAVSLFNGMGTLRQAFKTWE